MSSVQLVLLMMALALYARLVFMLDLIIPMGIEIWVLNLPVIILAPNGFSGSDG
jgi:hypothetical protein